MTTTGSVGALIPAGPAIAAWGAGLLLIALGAGALTADTGDVGSRALGLALAVAGLGALAWGGISLVRGRLIMQRGVGAAALTALGALTAAFILDPVGNSVLSVAATALLLTAVAVWTSIAARRPSRPRRNAGILGIIVAAVLVAGITTPALAASEVARISADSGGTVTVPAPRGHGH
ncbi:thiol:disulfide interchange protein [Microbacterium sp. AK009]|uniref:hypothetical protein n=1 Tax=Microbacterium sp. AK009 TaxID=2723068 RepID=UPI0015C9DD80|nr:hypothetical protein [Microbacterium sp. AK009]NYF16978.1 thiol:disulfide interchange protein [Microbacterium sp. AK009]